MPKDRPLKAAAEAFEELLEFAFIFVISVVISANSGALRPWNRTVDVLISMRMVSKIVMQS